MSSIHIFTVYIATCVHLTRGTSIKPLLALIVTLGYDDAVESGLGALSETQTDGKNAEAFFLKCKYAVFWYHNNITEKNFWTLCNQLAKHEYPETCRRLVVIFSGHGGNGKMCFTEQETVSINEMVNLFKPANAENPTLGHMARIFFIDACRGQNEALGYPCKSFTMTERVEIERPNDSNMIVAYATTEGYICSDGIWLTTLFKELENPHVNLLDALVKVNIRMDTKKMNGESYQVGEHKSTLVEQIYFIPDAGLDQPSKRSNNIFICHQCTAWTCDSPVYSSHEHTHTQAHTHTYAHTHTHTHTSTHL